MLWTGSTDRQLSYGGNDADNTDVSLRVSGILAICAGGGLPVRGVWAGQVAARASGDTRRR